MFNSQGISRRSLLKGGAMVAAALTVTGLENFTHLGQVLAADPTDIDILNYALTLEHLEYAFYRDGLARFSGPTDFDFLRRFGDRENNSALKYFGLIRDHEKEHVETLTKVIQDLGGTPVAEAKYDFKYTDVFGFVKTAQTLENTGVMAYDGAIALIQNPDLQTASATIATVEARHAAYLNYINNAVPFPTDFDTPKTMAQILALAGPFIVSDTASGSVSNGGNATVTPSSPDAMATSAGPVATATPGGSAATATSGIDLTATVGSIVKTLVPTALP